VAGFVERDEHVRDDLAQASVHSTGKGGGIEIGSDRCLFLRRIGIHGNIEKSMMRGFVVLDGASLFAFGVNAEIDFASLPQWDERGRVDGCERHGGTIGL
jgi:hypothetical protein